MQNSFVLRLHCDWERDVANNWVQFIIMELFTSCDVEHQRNNVDAITHCEWTIRDELYFQILMNVQLVRQTNVIKTQSVQINLVHILANV